MISDWRTKIKAHPGIISPTTLTLLLTTLLVAGIIGVAGGDPLTLARIGTRFSQGDPKGTEGYDGQFVYYIARNPNPRQVALLLDVPAYRYQRILLPVLARLLSLGNEQTLPWALAALGILAQVAGTWVVEKLFTEWGISRWYALLYGLWVGFVLGIIVDLPEPLAYALVAGALYAVLHERHALGWFLFGLATFAKEVAILFAVAYLLVELLQRRWWHVLLGGLVSIVPFGLFQLWLWLTFGQLGLGSGGNMATPFEWIPFMGLLRIGGYSWLYLLAMLVVFGPTVVWPAMWGVWKAIRFWLAGDWNMLVIALLLNSLMIVFLPFSTFREPGGLLRLVCGLVLAVLLFAGRYRQKRVLNYCCFWMVLNVFAFKS